MLEGCLRWCDRIRGLIGCDGGRRKGNGRISTGKISQTPITHKHHHSQHHYLHASIEHTSSLARIDLIARGCTRRHPLSYPPLITSPSCRVKGRFYPPQNNILTGGGGVGVRGRKNGGLRGYSMRGCIERGCDVRIIY